MTAPEGRNHTIHVDDLACADLVLGLMPEGERAAALAHAAACTQCEERLRAHVGATQRAAFDRPGARRGATVVASDRAGAWYRRPAWGVALAAAAALVAVGVLPLVRPAVHTYAPGLPLPGESVRTREGLAEDPHITAGLAAYAAHDLATADRELTAAHPTGAAEQLRRVYLADVRLARGDAPGALTLLRSLRWLDVPEPWRRDGAVLLARALRRTGDGASADSIERALRTLDPGTPFVP